MRGLILSCLICLIIAWAIRAATFREKETRPRGYGVYGDEDAGYGMYDKEERPKEDNKKEESSSSSSSSSESKSKSKSKKSSSSSKKKSSSSSEETCEPCKNCTDTCPTPEVCLTPEPEKECPTEAPCEQEREVDACSIKDTDPFKLFVANGVYSAVGDTMQAPKGICDCDAGALLTYESFKECPINRKRREPSDYGNFSLPEAGATHIRRKRTTGCATSSDFAQQIGGTDGAYGKGQLAYSLWWTSCKNLCIRTTDGQLWVPYDTETTQNPKGVNQQPNINWEIFIAPICESEGPPAENCGLYIGMGFGGLIKGTKGSTSASTPYYGNTEAGGLGKCDPDMPTFDSTQDCMKAAAISCTGCGPICTKETCYAQPSSTCAT